MLTDLTLAPGVRLLVVAPRGGRIVDDAERERIRQACLRQCAIVHRALNEPRKWDRREARDGDLS